MERREGNPSFKVGIVYRKVVRTILHWQYMNFVGMKLFA